MPKAVGEDNVRSAVPRTSSLATWLKTVEETRQGGRPAARAASAAASVSSVQTTCTKEKVLFSAGGGGGGSKGLQRWRGRGQSGGGGESALQAAAM